MREHRTAAVELIADREACDWQFRSRPPALDAGPFAPPAPDGSVRSGADLATRLSRAGSDAVAAEHMG